MLNYIRSEYYRVFRSTLIYATAGILALMILALNLVLASFNRMDPGFPYGTTSYSFSLLVTSPMFYCLLALLLMMVLYESNRRNGNLKNSVAYGISRSTILVGKCIVGITAALFLLTVLLPVYIGSAYLLLPHAGPVHISDMLMEAMAVSLIAVASLILCIVLLELFEHASYSFLIWLAIVQIIPTILLYLGIKIDVLRKIAMWMPWNFFKLGMKVNTVHCIALWDTTRGLVRCLVTGALGILIFGISGTVLVRRKDLG